MRKQHLPIKLDDDNTVILTWVLDPLSVHVPKFHSYEGLIYSSSMIMNWLSRSLKERLTALEGLKSKYVYWNDTAVWDDCVIDEKGIMVSSEDPDLYPLILFRTEYFRVYIYEADIVAIIEDGNTTITRMD